MTVPCLPPPWCQPLRAARCVVSVVMVSVLGWGKGRGAGGQAALGWAAQVGGWLWGPSQRASAESLGPLGKALVTGWEGGRWRRTGRGLQPLVFSDPSCSEREGGKYLGTRLGGGGGGGAPGGSGPYSFLEHRVVVGVTRCLPVCLMPPRPVCSAFSGTRASICEAWGLLCSSGPRPTLPSCLQLPGGAGPSLDTITHEAERKPWGAAALAPGHLPRRAPFMRDPGLLWL